MHVEALRRITSIIVPTDLQPSSTVAFEHALALSAVLKTEFAIIHVGDPDAGDKAAQRFPAVRDTLARWDLIEAGADRRDVQTRTGISVKKIGTRARDKAAAVVAYVDRHPASLLVAGTAGRRGLTGLFQPSVAARIARETRLPTLFLPRSTGGFVASKDGSIGIRNILVPVDETPGAAPALALARECAFIFGDGVVNIEMLHVGDRSYPAPPDDASSRWRFHNVPGDPAQRIAEASHAADLIIMTTIGRCGAMETFIGSTAERVVAQAACAVMTVPVG